MKRFGIMDVTVVALAAISFSLTGCGNGNVGLDLAGKEIPATAVAETNREATSVSPSGENTESSPAEIASKLPAADALPDEVCERFLDLLQSGNRLSAENLLTRTALAITGKADLKLEPLGGPMAKYKLAKPMYATTKQKLAQVECTVIDELDGKAFETSLTWMLSKQNEGWRISGMIVQFEEDQPLDLLSFENFDDVRKIKNTIGTENVTVEKQADAKNSDLN